jgi:hypothetical protein
MRKIRFAAGLVALAAATLSSIPASALPGSNGFAPAAAALVVRIADIAVSPRAEIAVRTGRHCWRRGNGRLSCVWAARRPRYAPYAYEPPYRYAEGVYAYYPAYDRPFAYSPLGRYYAPEYPVFYLPGFYGEPLYADGGW